MGQLRPVALSIAGLDPSSGAGLMADIKTFEIHKIYGLGVPTCITYQHDTTFQKVEWITLEKITAQIDLLKERFPIAYIKIGLIENLNVLDQLLIHLHTCLPNPYIIWDPVLRTSTGYAFHTQPDTGLVEGICKKIFLLTPNIPEALLLGKSNHAIDNAKQLSNSCHVYLKGGHSNEKKGKDFLFTKDGKEFSYNPKQKRVSEKHGSGCVLSAAITANLAKKSSLHRACMNAKEYTAAFLSSNPSLIGYHKR